MKYLVNITETLIYSKEISAKDEDTAYEKAQALFEKDKSKFECEQEEIEIEVNEE